METGGECLEHAAVCFAPGANPRALITTTPRPNALLKRLLLDPGTVTSRSTTFDNSATCRNHSSTRCTKRYGGTRLGRQELNGELIEDDPGAIFKREQSRMRGFRLCRSCSALWWRSIRRRALAPGAMPAALSVRGWAMTAGVTCWMIIRQRIKAGAMGQACRGALYARGPPRGGRGEPGRRHGGTGAARGGWRPVVPRRARHAGKKARAEPVAALYEQGRVSHVGAFPDLEDEMCSIIGEGKKSPDRLDALVWAVSDLMLKRWVEPRIRML